MNNPSLVNSSTNQSLDYGNLFADVKYAVTTNTVVVFKDIHQFTLHLLINITRNLDIVVSDNSVPDKDLNYDIIKIESLPDSTDIISSIIKSKSSISIFTSGTTGKPKLVKHSLRRFIEMSRVGDKYKNNVWAFTYSPTHMAGLQVLFQAILNRNTLIFLFSATRKKFIEQCRLYSVTNVSATPTFYRLLAPFDFQLSSVTNVTLGGEKSTPNLIEAVKKVFPTARVHNIYASTEAGTLFVSHGENFKIAPELIDKVQIRNNEILLHKSILGEFHGDEWFSTGDMVEFLNENKDEFIILSRSDDFINIGGNRINLITVENELLSIPEIINARVFSKDNSIMGKVVAAEVVVSSGSLTKLQILKSLAQKLPSYMIPMSIDIVDVLSVTHSGKLRRTK